MSGKQINKTLVPKQSRKRASDALKIILTDVLLTHPSGSD